MSVPFMILRLRLVSCTYYHSNASSDLRPKRRLLDEEVPNGNVRHVPKDERHWSAWLSVASFRRVPDVAIAIDAAGSVAVDVDTVAGQNEASMVVLKGDGIGIIAPIRQVIGELHSKYLLEFGMRRIRKLGILTVHWPRHSIVTSFTTGFSLVAIQ